MNSIQKDKKVYRCFKECLALGQEYELLALEKIKKLNRVEVRHTNQRQFQDYVS